MRLQIWAQASLPVSHLIGHDRHTHTWADGVGGIDDHIDNVDDPMGVAF